MKENFEIKKEDVQVFYLFLKTSLQSSPAPKILVLGGKARLRGWLVYFLSAIFISLFTCCSVSIYPWWGLLLGRNDHFQQRSLRIRATCHIVPVTTNDYQCIWAGCQCAGLGTAGGRGREGGVEGVWGFEEMVEVGAARSKETEV